MRTIKTTWRLFFRFGTLGVLCLVLWAGGAVAQAARASEDRALENRVKAAYLFKFADYVEWPDGAFAARDAPLVFGVLGNDALHEELARQLSGRNVGGHPLEVRRLREGDSANGAHVLFVSQGRGRTAAEALDPVAQRPALVVSDNPAAMPAGSIINFAMVDGKVRFQISVEAAEKRGLKLSSRLLAVALNAQGRVR